MAGAGRGGAAGARRGAGAAARAFVLRAQTVGVPEKGTAGPPEIVLREGAGTVGAAASCDYVIDVDAVSGTHAKVEVRGRKVLVTDLGSTNGTSVSHMNVRPNMPQQLGPGRKVVFGDIKAAYFLVEDEDVEVPPPKASAPAAAEPVAPAAEDDEGDEGAEGAEGAAAEGQGLSEPPAPPAAAAAPPKEKKVKPGRQWFNFKRPGKPAKE